MTITNLNIYNKKSNSQTSRSLTAVHNDDNDHDDGNDDDDDGELCLWNGRPVKDVKSYFESRRLSEFPTIAKLWDAMCRFLACAKPVFRLLLNESCSSDSHYTTTAPHSYIKWSLKTKLENLVKKLCNSQRISCYINIDQIINTYNLHGLRYFTTSVIGMFFHININHLDWHYQKLLALFKAKVRLLHKMTIADSITWYFIS